MKTRLLYLLPLNFLKVIMFFNDLWRPFCNFADILGPIDASYLTDISKPICCINQKPYLEDITFIELLYQVKICICDLWRPFWKLAAILESNGASYLT